MTSSTSATCCQRPWQPERQQRDSTYRTGLRCSNERSHLWPPKIDVVERARKPRRNRLVATVSVAAVSISAIGSGIALLLWDWGAPEDKFAPLSAHAIGRADAPVTVVVFADFQCPACRVFSTTQELQLRDELVAQGQVRLVFRHLAFIGAESVQAARASECAGEQDLFWKYHDKLYENGDGENTGAFADDNLRRFAAELRLNEVQFGSCLSSKKYADLIAQEQTAARRLTVSATPRFFINGQKFQGLPRDYETLKQSITDALAAAAKPS